MPRHMESSSVESGGTMRFLSVPTEDPAAYSLELLESCHRGRHPCPHLLCSLVRLRYSDQPMECLVERTARGTIIIVVM